MSEYVLEYFNVVRVVTTEIERDNLLEQGYKIVEELKEKEIKNPKK